MITAPVQIADCQAVLVTTENRVAALCQHENINKWSYDKPFRSPEEKFYIQGEPIAQTRARRRAALKAADYGLHVHTYRYPSQAVTALKQGIDWEYLMPRGDAYGEPWRLGDFDLYNSEEAPWFNLIISGQTSGAKGDTIHLAMGNVDFLWLWENMSTFASLDRTRTYVGVILIPLSGGQAHFYRICPIEDFDDKKLNFTITSELSLGKYKAVPAMVRYDSAPTGPATLVPELQAIGGENFPGVWIPLPTSGIEGGAGSQLGDEGVFEVTSVAQNDPTKFITVGLQSGSVNWVENYDGSWTGTVKAVIKVSYSASALRSPLTECYMECVASNGNTVTKTFTLTKGSSTNVDMGTFTLHSVTEPKEIDEAPLNYELRVKLDGVQYTKKGTVYIRQ